MTTAARSPLRWQTSSHGQKGRMGSAASGRLQHLQAVATWASAQVPSLGAFLGSRLASTSQLLASPPRPSPHFTCQRCESILQVGINCTVRVKSRKKKKQSSVSKEASPPINCIIYYCHYCAFENMKLGTSKAYVKTKLSEMAARHKLSELNTGLGERTTKGFGEKTTKASNKELMSATKVSSTESAGSSGKKTKRKGWLSLKQLAASSTDLSPTGSRLVLMRSTISTLTPPQIINFPKLMPKFSQVDSKGVTPVSELGVNSINVNFELEQCNTYAGDIGSKKTSNLINCHKDPATAAEQSLISTTNVMCLSASPHQQQTGLSDLFEEAALSSQHDVECVHPVYNIDAVSERQPTNVTDSPRKLVQSDVTMEELSCYQSDANAVALDQLTVARSVSEHDKLSFAALGNFSTLGTESLPDVPEDGVALKTLQSPSKKERVLMSDIDVALNLSIVKPARLLSSGLNKLENKSDKGGQSLSNKREVDDHDRSEKVVKKQKPMAPSDLDGYVDTSRGKLTSNFIRVREVQSNMKPLFRRMGRHWFTKCRSRTIKWRLI